MVIVMAARRSRTPPLRDATDPSGPHRRTPSSRARRARIGTLLMFTANGLTFASLVSRHPQIKAGLGASRTTWGLAAGSGLTVATWSRRWGFTIHPVLIGLLGDTVSLRWALVCLPAGAALILMATPAFQPVTAAPPDRHIHRGDDSLSLIDQRPVRRWPRRAAAPRRHVPG